MFNAENLRNRRVQRRESKIYFEPNKSEFMAIDILVCIFFHVVFVSFYTASMLYACTTAQLTNYLSLRTDAIVFLLLSLPPVLLSSVPHPCYSLVTITNICDDESSHTGTVILHNGFTHLHIYQSSYLPTVFKNL